MFSGGILSLVLRIRLAFFDTRPLTSGFYFAKNNENGLYKTMNKIQ